MPCMTAASLQMSDEPYFLPKHQAAAAHKEFHRHVAQRRGDSDMDCDANNAPAYVAEAQGKVQMGACKPRGIAAPEHFH